MIERDRGRDR